MDAKARDQLSAPPQQITVKLMDGRNGHAIKNVTVGMWLGEKAIWPPDLARNTNHDGTAFFSVSSEQQDFVIWGISIVDCRAPKGTAKQPVYRFSDVLSHGVVAENKCGKASAQAIPGQLILFVRQPHWWEKAIWE